MDGWTAEREKERRSSLEIESGEACRSCSLREKGEEDE